MRHVPLRLRQLLARDRRYRAEAYQFLQESLVHAQQRLQAGTRRPAEAGVEPASEPSPETHLTGQELCEALRARALEQFGYLAKTVLNSWGVRTTGDFGEIVYNLIAIECLRKSKQDRREDFDDVYDFDDVFLRDFRITL